MYIILPLLFVISMQALWKAYIDFEIQTAQAGDGAGEGDEVEAGDEDGQGNENGRSKGMDRVRDLYERLLQKTSHVKVRTIVHDYDTSVQTR